jgi:hypothetical protein
MAQQGGGSQQGDLRFNAILEDNVSPQVDKIARKMKELGASKHEIKLMLRAQDEVSAKAHQVKQTLDKLPKETKLKLTVAHEAAIKDLHRVRDKAAEIAHKPIDLVINVKSNVENEMHKVEAHVQNMRARLQSNVIAVASSPAIGVAQSATAGALQTIGSTIGVPLASAATGAGVAAIAQQSFQLNSQKEQDIQSLRSTLKSVAASQAEYAKVAKFSQQTPFGQQEVLQSDIALRTYGIDPQGKAGLETAGDIAAGTNQSLDRSTYAITAAMQRGDYRLLRNIGINIDREDFSAGGRFAGMSPQQAIGKVSELQYGGAAENKARTFEGMTSNVQDVTKQRFLLPIGQTGFSQAKGVLENANQRITGSGPDAADFQRKLATIVTAVNNAVSSITAEVKKISNTFDVYFKQPLTEIVTSLGRVGAVFGKTFGGVTSTALKMAADTLVTILEPLAKIAEKAPALIQIFAGLKAIQFLTGGKIAPAKRLEEGLNPLSEGFGPRNVLGGVKDLVKEAPKAALLLVIANAASRAQASNAVKTSFEEYGNAGEQAAQRIIDKFSSVNVVIGTSSVALRKLAAEVSSSLRGANLDAKGREAAAVEGAQSLAQLEKEGYGKAFQRLVIPGLSSRPDDVGGYLKEQYNYAESRFGGLSEEKRNEKFSQIEKNYQIYEPVLKARDTKSRAGSLAQGMEGADIADSLQQFIADRQISAKVLAGDTALGVVNQDADMGMSALSQTLNPTAGLLKELDAAGKLDTFLQNMGTTAAAGSIRGKTGYLGTPVEKIPRNLSTKTQEQYDTEFGAAQKKGTLGQLVSLGQGQAEGRLEANINQNRLAGQIMGGLPGQYSNYKLPQVTPAYLQQQAGVDVSALSTRGGIVSELLKQTSLAESLPATIDRAQQKYGELDLQAKRLTLTQEGLSNATASYTYDAIVPAQRAMEDYSRVMLQTSRAMEDSSYRSGRAQFSMSQYTDGLLEGTNALNDQVQGLDMYQKQLQYLQLQQRGMMQDLSTTTVTRGYSSVIKPLMGFGLENAIEQAGRRKQMKELEKDLRVTDSGQMAGDVMYQMQKNMRTGFQGTEFTATKALEATKTLSGAITTEIFKQRDLQETQHKQTLTMRGLEDSAYAAQKGLRAFQDAQEKLRRETYQTNRALMEQDMTISQLTDLLPTVRNQAAGLELMLGETIGTQSGAQAETLLNMIMSTVGGMSGFNMPNNGPKSPGGAGDQLVAGVGSTIATGVRQTLNGDYLVAAFNKLTGALSLITSPLKSFEKIVQAPTSALGFNNSIAKMALTGVPIGLAGVVGGAGVGAALARSGSGPTTPRGGAIRGGIVGAGLAGATTLAAGGKLDEAAQAALALAALTYAYQATIGLIPTLLGKGLIKFAGQPFSPATLERIRGNSILGPVSRGAERFIAGDKISTQLNPLKLGRSVGGGVGALVGSQIGGAALGLPGALLGGALGGYAGLAGTAKAGEVFFRPLKDATGNAVSRVRDASRIRGLVDPATARTAEAVARLSSTRTAEVALARIVADVATIKVGFGAVGTTLLKAGSRLLSLPAFVAGEVALASIKVISDKAKTDPIKLAQGPTATDTLNVLREGLSSITGGLTSGLPLIGTEQGQRDKARADTVRDLLFEQPSSSNANLGYGKFRTRRQDEREESKPLRDMTTVAREIAGATTVAGQGLGGSSDARTLRSRLSKGIKQADFLEMQLISEGASPEIIKEVAGRTKRQKDLLESLRNFNKEQKQEESNYTKGMEQVRKGANTNDQKLVEEGYKNIKKATGAKLKDIRAMVKAQGAKTGKEYANAIDSMFQSSIPKNNQGALDKALGAFERRGMDFGGKDGVSGKERDKLLKDIADSVGLSPEEIQGMIGNAKSGESAVGRIRRDIDAKDKTGGLFTSENAKDAKKPTGPTKSAYQKIQEGAGTHEEKMADIKRTARLADRNAEKTYFDERIAVNTDKMQEIRHRAREHQKWLDGIEKRGGATIIKTNQTLFDGIMTNIGTFKQENGITEGRAHGGLIEANPHKIGPGYPIRVAEEGHPEMIIPLAPHRRERAKMLIDQTRSMVGYANGGVAHADTDSRHERGQKQGGVSASAASTRQDGRPRRGRGGSGVVSEGTSVMDRVMTRANEIDHRHFPYLWGGGHGSNMNGPYDCSGAVSSLLRAAGFFGQGQSMVSGAMMGIGKPGAGAFSIYANPEHVYAVLNGRAWGTSGENPGGGAGWIGAYTSRPGFAVRHIPDIGRSEIRASEKGGSAEAPSLPEFKLKAYKDLIGKGVSGKAINAAMRHIWGSLEKGVNKSISNPAGPMTGKGRNLAAGEKPKRGVLYNLGASAYGFTAGDDTGVDTRDRSLFSGPLAVAELGFGGRIGNMLGQIPYGTRARVAYKGKAVGVTFRDVGSGGGPVNGRPRALDLHARAAKQIGFPNGLDTVQFSYANGGVSRPGPAWAGWHAKGGEFRATGPTLFGVGEKGPERVSITPENKAATSSKSDGLLQKLLDVATGFKTSYEASSARALASKIRGGGTPAAGASASSSAAKPNTLTSSQSSEREQFKGAERNKMDEAGVTTTAGLISKAKGVLKKGTATRKAYDKAKRGVSSAVKKAGKKVSAKERKVINTAKRALTRTAGYKAAQDVKAMKPFEGKTTSQLGGIVARGKRVVDAASKKLTSVTKAAGKSVSKAEKKKIADAKKLVAAAKKKIAVPKRLLNAAKGAYETSAQAGGVGQDVIDELLDETDDPLAGGIQSDRDTDEFRDLLGDGPTGSTILAGASPGRGKKITSKETPAQKRARTARAAAAKHTAATARTTKAVAPKKTAKSHGSEIVKAIKEMHSSVKNAPAPKVTVHAQAQGAKIKTRVSKPTTRGR